MQWIKKIAMTDHLQIFAKTSMGSDNNLCITYFPPRFSILKVRGEYYTRELSINFFIQLCAGWHSQF